MLVAISAIRRPRARGDGRQAGGQRSQPRMAPPMTELWKQPLRNFARPEFYGASDEYFRTARGCGVASLNAVAFLSVISHSTWSSSQARGLAYATEPNCSQNDSWRGFAEV